MKSAVSKGILKNVIDRGYVLINDTYYPPNSADALKATKISSKRKPRTVHIKTGDINDTRNIKNRDIHKDSFDKLVEIEMNVIIWNEFYPSAERMWRIDKSIPEYKIALEIEGGVFSGGRHTRPVGFINDMEKYNYLAENGWTLIRVTPATLMSMGTIDSIKKIISNKPKEF